MTHANGRPRACVLKADGTNCEVETVFGLEQVGARAEIVPMNVLRAGERRLRDFDLLVVPGGFSYGDDVGAGKVLAVELMSFLADEMAAFASAGKPILGICNGFQVLTRTGLLPFGKLGTAQATMSGNLSGRFECRWVRLRRESSGPAAVLSDLPDVIELPTANGEGRFWADDETLARIEDQGLVALRYVDAAGAPTADYPANPHGALHAIAGVVDPSGRVLGLMPHPERYLAPFHHPAWHARRVDGTGGSNGGSEDHDREPDGLALLRAFVELA